MVVCAARVCVAAVGGSVAVQMVDNYVPEPEVPQEAVKNPKGEAVLPRRPKEQRRYPRQEPRQNKDGRQMIVPSQQALKKRNQKRKKF
ncbi:MAG: hypothetical protein NC218_07140 [Acetobacter sp.]|nr:hypothetical protein [Acetobacter sp.]